MPKTLQLNVEQRSVADLRPDPKNARTHSVRQIYQIAGSIREFGFVNPILLDETGSVIAGHGRLAAAKSLGLESVPIIELDHLSRTQKRALMLADNKIGSNAGWDIDLLAETLGEILADDLDFNLDVIGFETAEVDLLLPGSSKPDAADVVEAPDRSRPAVSRPGDLWRLGEHLLLCGDALEEECFRRLLGDGKAQMTLTDPPYNVKIGGNVSGLGKAHHAEFAMASGEMSEAEFAGFLDVSLTNIAAYSAKGAVVMVFMDWRHITELIVAGKRAFSDLLNLCVWNKSNGGMGSLYRSKHELVAIFKSGQGHHINNIELGRHGRYRTNVWDYAGANAFSRDRDADLADHPTVKPIAMIADAIKDCSRRGGLVLDPFGGSGTTILAAERTGRRARVMELDPHYVDVAIRRWLRSGGAMPTLADSDETFAGVEASRLEETGDSASVVVLQKPRTRNRRRQTR